MADKFGGYHDAVLGAVRARYIEETELAQPYWSVAHAALNYVWDSVGGAWIKQTPAAGGGGGGIVSQGPRDASAQAWLVDGSAVTQPISAVTLPLPTGAATEATLAALSAKLPAALVGGRLDVNIGAPATLPVSGTFWQATQPVSGTFWQATQPISAVALPLPAGAAQEHVGAASFHSARLTDGTSFYKGTTPADTQPVSGTFWQVTQPVSGTFWQATQPISAATLPLPTGAATEATLLNVSGTTAATAAAVPARAIYNGLIAKTAMPTATADGQLTGMLGDQYGRQVFANAPESLWGQGRVTLTTVTSTAVLAAAGAGVKWAITDILVCITLGTTATRLDILDGATLIHSFAFVQTAITAGEQRNVMYQFRIPYKGTANTAVNAQLSVAVTDCRVVLCGFKTIL